MNPQADPSWLPTLDDAAVSHTLDVPPSPDVEPDFLALPARPGVAVFQGENDRPLLIATTADLRELARRRLGQSATASEPATAPAAPTPPRADHRAVTRRVLAVEVGSALEADVVYLAQARLRMPEIHRLVSQRWRAWFVRIDPDAEFPQWTKTCLTGGVAPRSAAKTAGDADELGRGVLLGPLADKDSAGRFIELAIDAFDLCREFPLLVQAPKAKACPYKEMGRCPAPCDGSEPMASYRLRTRRAVETLTRGLADMRDRLAADMTAAAAATAFELAGELKQQLNRLEALAGPAFAHINDVHRWRAALVVPSPKPGKGRVLLLAGARLGIADQVDLTAAAPTLEPLAARLLEAARTAPPLTGTPAQLDTLAAVTRWLFTAGTRRRGVLVPIHDDTAAGGLAAEIASAAKSLRKVKDASVPDQAIET
jgi:DNA polymerase-3 subunit epsilon